MMPPGVGDVMVVTASATTAPVPPFAAPSFAGGTIPEVLHVDDALIVCDKPAGLLAVPGRGDAGRDCLLARLLPHWPDAEVVHRLDMATSGLIVFARGKAAQRALGMAFAAREVAKRYEAVVHGRVAAQPGATWDIDLPLAADWPNRPRQKVDAAHGKPSHTRVRLLSHDEAAGTSRVSLWPLTGRSHQLRVHLMATGHPIVGDALYAPAQVASMSPRLLLHACALGFVHPQIRQSMHFDSRPAF